MGRRIYGTPLVSYVARVDTIDRGGKKNTLRLRYELDYQIDERVKDQSNNLTWGVSVINWGSSGLTESAEWFDRDDPSHSGSAQKVTVPSGQEPSGRLKASVLVNMRPKQAALRAALFVMDHQCCVLTAEKEASTLDAAHIVPVKAGGVETVENAILLRTDLHRLFDAGLFWFDVSEKGAVVEHSQALSDRYSDILTDAKLPASTFERVELALRERAKHPDGNGRRGIKGG